MKSKWTTYLLLVLVVALWGVIVKKIFFDSPDKDGLSAPVVSSKNSTQTKSDSLMLNYPDPFLSGGVIPRSSQSENKSVIERIVNPLPPKPLAGVKKEVVRIKHLGSVVHGGRTTHIIELNSEQHPMEKGEQANGFVLKSCDADSVYFEKDGLVYSAKLAD